MVRNERTTASGDLAVIDIALAPITLTFGRRPAPDRSLLGQRLPCRWTSEVGDVPAAITVNRR